MDAPKKKKFWKKSETELFVDLVFKEAEKGNRPDGGQYPRGTWSTIRDKINETMGTNYTKVQVFDKMDTTRTAWKRWCALVSAPELKWNPVTRKFGATDSEWMSYKEENPRAGSYRRKPIAHEEKLAFVFKGIIEPGRPYVRRKRKTAQDGESSSTNVAICSPAEPKEIREAPPLEHPKAPVKYSFGECVKHLDEMEEVEKGNELYLYALEMFLKKDHREIFLKMENNASRLAWLLRLRAIGFYVIDVVYEA